MAKKLLFLLAFAVFGTHITTAQHSIARQWNEALLQSVREDFARPPVHARNLFHISAGMYDAWAAYDSTAKTYLLGKTISNYTCPFAGIPAPADREAARNEAISYAAYRILLKRFSLSPNAAAAVARYQNLMIANGYNFNNASTDYQSGSPAALGNYIAQCYLAMGNQDGANEINNYAIQYYQPVNPPLVVANPGAANLLDPNRWQPLTLTVAIDQNGNPIPSTQVFQSPEWGNVTPFSLKSEDLTTFQRSGHNYNVYHDPGPMPFLDTIAGDSTSDEYKWNFELVSAWSSHLDPNDGVLWDISPRSIGNVQSYPTTLAGYHDFYDLVNGSDPGIGRDTNPRTGLPYEPQIVPRGDYTRVLAQFWADGPTSETPPGHWFAILNYVMDHPAFVKKFNGKGPVLNDLEYDVKAYFTLGGGVHDAAVTAWGIKGWYDGVRPISALRYMAKLGQSSDPGLPHYHPAGLPLIPGLIELVQTGDPLAGTNDVNVGKIKLQAWRGNSVITDPFTQMAGVGWILAENWVPYQRKTFVTPPFAGYISGHSTYSRTAAEVLTRVTGDEYFPGGLGEFHIAANSNFLGLEQGPSVDVTLQWATYRDASDQTSLSRIWGGIHPPFDDIPGRLIGMKLGDSAFKLARSYFYADVDNDGYYSYEDCNDQDATVYPGAPELCDGLDNDCNNLIDDAIPINTYYADIDGDGFGDAAFALDTCLAAAPAGFSANNLDCDDSNAQLNPSIAELCDEIDNNCNGLVDDDIPVYTYYADTDGDGFGNATVVLDTCLAAVPAGFSANNLDCDDTNADLNPGITEVCDGIDNNCNGMVDDSLTVYAYYVDSDGDGYGASAFRLDTCLSTAPAGYVSNGFDCNDLDAAINPNAAEKCDSLDNDCNGLVDDGIQFHNYYLDGDGDGFGTPDSLFASCLDAPPAGASINGLDCNDANPLIYPGAIELIDSVDNNCNGLIDIDDVHTPYVFRQTKVYPNPATESLTVYHPDAGLLELELYNTTGQLQYAATLDFTGNTAKTDISTLVPGIYLLKLRHPTGQVILIKVVKTNR